MTTSKWLLATVAFLAGFSLNSCASKEKVNCPTVEEEAISVCRAREKCRNQNSSVGLGVGLGMGNFGFGVGTSQSTGRYEACLDEDLKEQKEKSKSERPDTSGASSQPVR